MIVYVAVQFVFVRFFWGSIIMKALKSTSCILQWTSTGKPPLTRPLVVAEISVAFEGLIVEEFACCCNLTESLTDGRFANFLPVYAPCRCLLENSMKTAQITLCSIPILCALVEAPRWQHEVCKYHIPGEKPQTCISNLQRKNRSKEAYEKSGKSLKC